LTVASFDDEHGSSAARRCIRERLVNLITGGLKSYSPSRHRARRRDALSQAFDDEPPPILLGRLRSARPSPLWQYCTDARLSASYFDDRRLFDVYVANLIAQQFERDANLLADETQDTTRAEPNVAYRAADGQ
jgi:hypothetical protein